MKPKRLKIYQIKVPLILSVFLKKILYGTFPTLYSNEKNVDDMNSVALKRSVKNKCVIYPQYPRRHI